MEGVWYDCRLTGKLRDEAPAAYKDIRAVLKALGQHSGVTSLLCARIRQNLQSKNY